MSDIKTAFGRRHMLTYCYHCVASHYNLANSKAYQALQTAFIMLMKTNASFLVENFKP